MIDTYIPCWLRHNECCCNCKHHLKMMSHPWVNGFPITHQIGWLCAVDLIMTKGFEGQRAQLSQGHSVCELYQRAEDGPFCERTKEGLDMAIAEIKRNGGWKCRKCGIQVSTDCNMATLAIDGSVLCGDCTIEEMEKEQDGENR